MCGCCEMDQSVVSQYCSFDLEIKNYFLIYVFCGCPRGGFNTQLRGGPNQQGGSTFPDFDGPKNDFGKIVKFSFSDFDGAKNNLTKIAKYPLLSTFRVQNSLKQVKNRPFFARLPLKRPNFQEKSRIACKNLEFFAKMNINRHFCDQKFGAVTAQGGGARPPLKSASVQCFLLSQTDLRARLIYMFILLVLE